MDARPTRLETIGNASTRMTKRPAKAVTVVERAVPPDATPMQILGQAIARGATPEILSQLLDLQRQWKRDIALEAFNAAIAEAKGELPVIIKDTTVGFEHKQGEGRTDYMHETMAGIARVVNPILQKNGLSYRYRTNVTVEDGREWIYVTCILSHRGGHSEETTLRGPPDISGKKNPIQAIGSTTTYLQRYTLKAALGLAAAPDDDARGGPDEPIDQEQVDNLKALVAETGADLKKFLTWAKVKDITEITKPYYADCVATLEQKKKGKTVNVRDQGSDVR